MLGRARVGRDGGRKKSRGDLSCFNPRARVGRDPVLEEAGFLTAKFQSTRPRGARL